MSHSDIEVIQCPSCGTALDITLMPPFTRVACPNCHEETRVKNHFGPYHLERRFAIGGMSVVFLARDSVLDREVAIKILNEDFSADEKRIDAFEHEARVTASLSHPNIVRVLTTGRAFGRFFIAMELVPGGHFEHHIREQGRIPESQALKLAIQVAHGLQAAHQAKLIHRDVKPGNILLDADGNAKLVDFGLALVTHGGTARAKEFWATPYYVPPETIEGAPEDFRADIYAFGATLYHALAGKPPCDEESMATPVLRAAKKKIIPLHQAAPDLSMAICRIVDKAMAYNPGDRYASYEALLRDLESATLQAKLGIHQESAATVATRHARLQRRNRILIASACFGAAIAVISVILWLLQSPGKPHPADVVEQDDVDPVEAPAFDFAVAYQEAHSAMTQRDFYGATGHFENLLLNPDLQEPTRTWAGVQAVISALLDDDCNRASELTEAVLLHADAAEIDDDGIEKFILPILLQSQAEAPLSITLDSDGDASAAQLIQWIFAGLHNWHRHEPRAAENLIQRAATATLDNASHWAAFYQTVAHDYLHDMKLLGSPVFRDLPPSIEDTEATLVNLSELQNEIRSHGPAQRAIRQCREALTRHLDALAQLTPPVEDVPVESPPPEPPAPEPEIPPLEQIATHLADYRFRDARGVILGLAPDTIPHRQRNVMLTLIRYCQRFQAILTNDVSSNDLPFSEIRLKSGDTLAGISPGADDQLIDSEGNPVPWENIHPDSYIDWHRASVRRVTDEGERIRRHEAAIAFDLLAGDRERAVRAIEILSAEDSNFAEHWKYILKHLPN